MPDAMSVLNYKNGMISVIARAENRGRNSYWLVRCSGCNKEYEVAGSSLRGDGVKSCFTCASKGRTGPRGPKVITKVAAKVGGVSLNNRNGKYIVQVYDDNNKRVQIGTWRNHADALAAFKAWISK